MITTKLLFSKVEAYYLKSLKKLKKHIFIPIPPNQPNRLQTKFEREQYLGLFFGLIAIYLTDIFDYGMGYMDTQEFVGISITIAIALNQLFKKNIKSVKLVCQLTTVFLPFIWIYVQKKIQLLLAVQIFLSLFPVINIIISNSLSISFVLLVMNIAQSFFILRPKIHLVLNFDEDDPRYMMVSFYISKSFGYGLAFMGIFGYIQNSRAHLITKLCDKQKKLEMLNKELTEKNQQLEEVVKSKMNLLLSVSHEVRNPLNVISGFTELALMDEPSERTIPHLYNIQSGAKLLLFLINNLLIGSKVEYQELELSKDHVKTFDFINTIWDSSKMLISKTKLYGHLFVSKNMPEYIEVDEMRVTQIIYNLVGNATKFTTQGYISIVISWIDSELITPVMNKPTQESYFREFLSGRIPKLTRVSTSKEIDIEIKKHKNKTMNEINLEANDTSELSIMEESLITAKHINKYLECAKTLSYIQFFESYDNVDLNSMLILRKTPKIPSNINQKGYLKIEVIDI